MSLRALVDKLQFWKPKAERIATKKAAIPEKKIDVFGGTPLGRLLGGSRARDIGYSRGGVCESKRRGFSRAAILPADRKRELARSRRPAKNQPHGTAKQRCFVLDPVTRKIVGEKWLRPAEQSEFTIRAGHGVTWVPASESELVAAD
jgi:hypothetical protein